MAHSFKWKSPSKSTIDFKLELRFPPTLAGEVDYRAMPIFNLLQWIGGDDYEFFDSMKVEACDWERCVPADSSNLIA